MSAVLPDGLRLSFAAYFSGTVGLEHLGVSLPGWAEEVDEKQRKKRLVRGRGRGRGRGRMGGGGG